MVPVTTQESTFADRLVYLTGIPPDATEQEVTALAGSFGKINNVILFSCSEEDSKQEGQQVRVFTRLLSYSLWVDELKNTVTQTKTLFPGLRVHDEERRRSGAGQVHQPLYQTAANHCLRRQSMKSGCHFPFKPFARQKNLPNKWPT